MAGRFVKKSDACTAVDDVVRTEKIVQRRSRDFVGIAGEIDAELLRVLRQAPAVRGPEERLAIDNAHRRKNAFPVKHRRRREHGKLRRGSADTAVNTDVWVHLSS